MRMKAILCAVLGGLVLAPAAHGATLHLRRAALSVAQAAASANAGGELAYLARPGELAVRRAGNALRTYSVPPGCIPQAVGGGVVALRCPGSISSILVLLQATGAVLPIALPSGVSADVALAVGSRWLLADTSSSPDGVHQLTSRALIELRTGRAIGLGKADPFGRREYPDLNAQAPGRRLCAPVVRAAGPSASDPLSDVKFATVQKIGQWVLQSGPTEAQLQRCGKKTVTRYPTGLDRHNHLTQDAGAVLGSNAIGYLQGHRIVYEDLRSGLRKTAPWPTTERPHLAMFGRRLVVSAKSPAGDYTIYVATP